METPMSAPITGQTGTHSSILEAHRFTDNKHKSQVWKNWVPEAFPGMRVLDDNDKSANGIASEVQLGMARIVSVIQSSQILMHDPIGLKATERTAGFVFQKSGKTEITQNDHTILLEEGGLCFIDGGTKFVIESVGTTHTHVVTLPRAFARDRLPGLFENTPSGALAGSTILEFLGLFVDQLFEGARKFEPPEQAALLSSIVSLISGVHFESAYGDRRTNWRVKRGLAMIEQDLGDINLCADRIANEQNISRRRLDQLFIEELGSSISSQISERRLTSAAAELCNPSKEYVNITTVAFRVGYRDSSHFSRAFRSRFGMTPRAWRAAALDSSE